MKIVLATEALSRRYYGSRPPVDMRGYFLVDDDHEPVGVAGFLRKSRDVKVIFSEGKPEAFKNKKTIMQLARMMMGIADNYGWTLIADRDETIPGADRFLRHLGFEVDENGEYVRWPH